MIVCALRHRHVADALARQRQGLAEAVEEDRVFNDVRDVRDAEAVVNELAVRLVADHVDRMADFLLLALQHRAELPDGFFGVDGTRRIVRVVHDDGLRAFANAGFRCVDVELEVLGVRWDDGELSAEVGGVAAVLGEERGEGQDFVARIEECAEDVVQAAGSAYGHDDVLGIIVGTVEAIQVFRNRGTHLRVACIGHITVDVVRRFLCRDAHDGVAHLLRDR